VALQDHELDPRRGEFEAAFLGGYRRAGLDPPPGIDRLPVFLMARRLARLGWQATRGSTQHAALVRDWLFGTADASARRFLAWAGER
jgi:hypothetical protein